jgi:uncharacterized protein
MAAEGFASRYGPWAVVAGASNGIGLGFAHQLAARGVDVVLVSRNREALDAAAEEVEAAHPGRATRVVVADLTSPDMAEVIGEATTDLDVGTVVYNAGAEHGAGLFHERPVDDALFLVDLNCRGPVLLAHRFVPRLLARGSGALVLMSSMAAVAGNGYVAAYSATKAFDINLAEGLGVELRPHGIDVMTVIAGATATPSLLGSGAQVDPDTFSLMQPEDVAREALDALGSGPVLVPGEANQGAFGYLRSIPREEASGLLTQGSTALYGLPPLV